VHHLLLPIQSGGGGEVAAAGVGDCIWSACAWVVLRTATHVRRGAHCGRGGGAESS